MISYDANACRPCPGLGGWDLAGNFKPGYRPFSDYFHVMANALSPSCRQPKKVTSQELTGTTPKDRSSDVSFARNLTCPRDKKTLSAVRVPVNHSCWCKQPYALVEKLRVVLYAVHGQMCLALWRP